MIEPAVGMMFGPARSTPHDLVNARPPGTFSRLFAGIVVVLFLGCSASQSGALRIDLERYLQHMSAWAPIEAETARTLERILATEFVDEAEILHQIADNRPRVLAHLERARSYTPNTATIQDVHRTYLGAWQRLLDGYASIEQGFSSADYTNLSRGRESMTSWRDTLVSVARQLAELAEHEGIPVSQPKPQLTFAHAAPETARPGTFSGPGPTATRSGDVLLSHTATVQYHRRWRA